MKINKDINLNAMRILGVEAVNKANSGHPGIVLGAAPIVYTLFTKIMKHNPSNSKWFNRDRFILSAGHGSALLYSALHLSGYDVTIEDMKSFRQWKSKTPGHPELGMTDGVEVTTGPLGQGIAMGVGMALAESVLEAKFNTENHQIIDHHTYVLCGDGDLQEGVSYEAISFAGKNELNKLILIHDSNDIQLDSKVSDAMSENMAMRFKAANWNVLKVKNGEDVQAIEKAILKAHKSKKPTYIEVKTEIGIGAKNSGTSEVHGSPLGAGIIDVKKAMKWTEEEFTIPASVYEFYKEVAFKNAEINTQWDNSFKEYKKVNKKLATELENALAGEITIDSENLLKAIPAKKEATRVSSGNIFNAIQAKNTTLVGGSADLTSSTKIAGMNGNYSPENRKGKNIKYGVREFAMAAINNGVAAHGGVTPFASGFFVFADYMKPAIRLSAIMDLQTLNIFTHDSVAVGEDGPTHQPIEQLAMLRSIPNHVVIRPADYAETVAAYEIALNNKKGPTSIVLTRQDLEQLPHKNVISEVNKGAYLIVNDKNATITLLASGSEVSLAIKVKEELAKDGIIAKVVSMPSTNLFEKQTKKYKDSIIDRSTLRVSIEMGATMGWDKYIGEDGLAFGIDRFGESAPGDLVIQKLGFTPEEISKEIMKKIR
ncbi:transketolase [Mesoplasma photuris]|uniref:transketolase n=1 Tax=Mesoplasma photuris TaxID=217731 RepID=UPI0004E1C7A6|nr:transketolase [Mesoplasma photuris]